MEIIIIIAVLVFLWILFDSKQKNTFTIDNRGYQRDGYGKLYHRRIAFKYVYDYPNTHNLRFSEYDVHHIDGNKLNNDPDNLEVLSREQHKLKHGIEDNRNNYTGNNSNRSNYTNIEDLSW